MKQFFKSTAIFACAALLFCACSDDGTEDLEVSSAIEVTSQTQLLPGDCRVWVKWVVPEDDSITSCNVSWTNAAGTADGTAQFDATTGWMEQMMTDIPAGLYTFAFQNFNYRGMGSSILTKDVYVYDDGTYLEYPTINSMYADDSGILMTWDEAPADCLGVKITYTKTNGVEATTLLTSIDEPILLSEASVNTAFTFATYFQPENGMDIIELPNNDSVAYQFPDTAPATPTEVAVRPGKDRFKLYWYVPQLSDITSTVIVYSKPGAVSDTIRVTSVNDGPLVKGAINELIITKTTSAPAEGETDYALNSDYTEGATVNQVVNGNLGRGEYNITIYNEKSLTNTVSESESVDVIVYDETDYAIDPTWSGYGTDNPEGLLYTGSEATVEWIQDPDINDCLGIIASFTDVDEIPQTTDMTPIVSMLTMKNVKYGTNGVYDQTSTFTYETFYCPETGLDTLVVSHTTPELIPERSSSTPEEVWVRPGDNLIFISYNLADDDTIATVEVTYDDGVESHTDEILVRNLNVGSENNYEIKNDYIVAGNLYNVSIRTRNEAGRSSGVVTAEGIAVYDYATFAASAIPPTISAYEFSGDDNSLSITWDYDTSATGVTMNMTYVCDPYTLDTKTITLTDDDFTDVYNIPDAMPGHPYSYTLTFTPAVDAMDDIPFPDTSGEFDPVDVNNDHIWQVFNNSYPTILSGTHAGIYASGDKYQLNTSADNITNVEEALLPGDYVYTDNGTWNFYEMFDDVEANYTGSGANFYCFEVNQSVGATLATKFGGGVTFDLSAYTPEAEDGTSKKYAYSLSEFTIYHCPGASYGEVYGRGTPKTFSLYGTDEDPGLNPNLSSVDDDGLPIMDNWTLLLDHVQITKPSLSYGNPECERYTDLDYWDANGDGVVNSSDDNLMYLQGWSFTITETKPVRYIRYIMNDLWADVEVMSTTNRLRIQEIDIVHSGFVVLEE